MPSLIAAGAPSTALAGGWYLMLPPLAEAMKSGPPINRDWVSAGAFDTARECEEQRQARIAHAELEAERINIEQNISDRPYTVDPSVHLSKVIEELARDPLFQAYSRGNLLRRSECIASNDPRLQLTPDRRNDRCGARSH